MRKKYVIFFFILILFCGLAEASKEIKIIALQSADLKPYDDALKGFKDALKGFKNVCGDCNIEKIVIGKKKESKIIERIHKSKPDIILSIGIDALQVVKKIEKIPIIYLMVLNPQSILSGEKNITGVSMDIPPEKQLDIFKKALHKLKRIGLLFDPNNTGPCIKRAQDAAKKLDIELIIRKVDSCKEVPSLLISMKDKIDAFWMLPDETVFCSEIINDLYDFLFQKFSMENKIPIFTFSTQFLEMGGLISLSFDAFDLGMQAGDLAGEILSGKGIRNVPAAEARKVIILTNSKMAEKLRITINNEIFDKSGKNH